MLRLKPVCFMHKNSQPVKQFMECYNITKECEEEEDPRNL